MKVTVCIGSSCHIKGSNDIVRLMQSRIEENGLSKKVELSGSFCLGRCSESGVSVKVDNEIICGVTCENFDSFFRERILDKGDAI